MGTRRRFLTLTAAGGAVAAAAPGLAQQPTASLPTNPQTPRYRPPGRLGMGGAPMANGGSVKTAGEILGAVETAWDEGVRYFDSSPWYGLGLGERRFGVFLHDKPREEYVFSTKIGRVLTPDETVGQVGNWRQAPKFRHAYDYSADGVRRSVEQSLQRLGMTRLDIVFIHDLSPDNGDMGERWTEYFEQARRGAMPELQRMKEEGIIKAWGLGVNTLPPALRAFQVADPDIILSATQYSLMKHAEALTQLFPVAAQRNASIVVGAPLNNGFLAGRDRYDYAGSIPDGAFEKRARMSELARAHDTDLRTAALHFANAPEVVSAIIPGARNERQARENAASMRTRVDPAFYQVLKREGLVAEAAPVPA